jgi:hypothetical protein
MQEEWMGASFPLLCGAGLGNAGTELSKLEARLKALHIIWPAD